METSGHHHRRALSWNCRRSGKISPATKDRDGGDGAAWWDFGRRTRSRAPSPSKDAPPAKDTSPKRTKSPPKDRNKVELLECSPVKDERSPTKSRPSSPLLALSRPSSGPSTRPSSPCCPLGPFISALSPLSGMSSPLSAVSPSYRLDSVVLWSSALFSPPSLIIDLDGRSKSLTHIDTLEDTGMLLSGEEREARESATDKLGVPDPHSLRRRKLSLATKVSSCEYMILILECYVDPVEEFVQASRGTSLR
ncbi:uncharacterized protein [Procambarus clarkii]|uniref:uncharacterized protein n=1 Tax=Procambarus clarkii TaxID=6728 RepID=UPI0037427161